MRWISILAVLFLACLLSTQGLQAQAQGEPTSSNLMDKASASAESGLPVSMVVTVQGRSGSELPLITAENVIVNESRSRAKITDWVQLRGDRAGLELFFLLDDSMTTAQGTQLKDVQHFIMAQPETTKIGVAYMQQGGTKIVQDLTTDHSLASAALHEVTLGNLANTPSPYTALQELIKKWPAGNDRREIIMISRGVDAVFGQGPAKENIYLDAAVADAQRAGVIVFTINSSRVEPGLNRTSGEEVGSGPGSRDRIQTDLPQNYLAQVADETGGVSYYQASGAPVSFAPYLEDATRRLGRQYQVTFLVKPEKKAGLRPVNVKVEVPHAEVTRAERVYVPATTQ